MDKKLNHNNILFEEYSRGFTVLGQGGRFNQDQTPKAKKEEKDKSDYKKSLNFCMARDPINKTRLEEQYFQKTTKSYYNIQ